MPYLIEHIDKIARKKGRDVLYIRFDRKIFPIFNRDDFPIRTKLIQCFNEKHPDYITAMIIWKIRIAPTRSSFLLFAIRIRHEKQTSQ